MRISLAAGSLALCLGGCTFLANLGGQASGGKSTAAQSTASAGLAPADAQHLETIEWARGRADAAKGEPGPARDFARAVSDALDAGVQQRAPDRPWVAWIDASSNAVTAALPKAENQLAAEMLRWSGKNLWVAGRAQEAFGALNQSLERRPDYDTAVDLVTAYALAGQPHNQASPELCAETKPLADDETRLLNLMYVCYAASPHEGDVPDKLPWASKQEVASFRAYLDERRAEEEAARERARQEAEARARREEEERARRDAMASQPAPATGQGSAAPSTPAAPSVVSVTLRNSCRETVRVFFGEKPKFGSGTYSSMGGNSRTSKQMRPGDMIWIVDESQNGLGGASVSQTTREIEILESCTGIVAR